MKQTSAERKQTRDEIRQAIIERSKEYFETDRSGEGYICPVCKSGSGEHGTGMRENPKKPNHFTCWRGCYSNADIFEIIGKEFGLSGFADQYNKACEIFGISLDDGTQTSPRTSSLKTGGNRPQRGLQHGDPQPTGTQGSQKEDFSAFCKEASKHIEETDYHRGISLETLKRYGVGFVPAWRHPNVPASVPTSPRLIIQNDAGGYLARDTREDLTENQSKYTKQRAGHVGLFNEEALKQGGVVWIVEGELDALSIIDAGGQAVALCSTANAKKLIEAVKEARPTAPLILALDNDQAGDEASRKIAEALKSLNFSFYRNKPESFKDANEFYMAEPAGFEEWVRTGIAEAQEVLQQAEDAEAQEREAFKRESVAYHLPEFLAKVKHNREIPVISTGFPSIDGMLGGGLFPGLVFVGALSSLGKTTLALQIADTIAASGHGVLIFSLEMSRFELMSKTLSRLTALESYELCDSFDFAKTTREIMIGDFTPDEENVVLSAIEEYSKFAENIHITEGVGNIGVAEIAAKTAQYVKHNGKPPVILIDYLQILSAPEKGLTDKQSVDKNVVELKRLSRDYDTPVIAISSFNRENYTKPVNMGSFKESGAVEYSSDVLIGLQYKDWDYKATPKGSVETDAARMNRLQEIKEANDRKPNNEPIEIELKVLKERTGRKGTLYFNFWPAFNMFEEGD